LSRGGILVGMFEVTPTVKVTTFLSAARGIFRETRGAEDFEILLNRYFYATGEAITVEVVEGGEPRATWSFTPRGWERGEENAAYVETIEVISAIACRFYRPVFRIGLRDRRRLAR
jgi:hypothetical protein